jgi:hypothetical protein
VPEQPVTFAGEKEGDRNLRVDLSKPPRKVANIQKSILKLARAEEVFVGRRPETVLRN